MGEIAKREPDAVSETNAIIQVIERAASNPSVDIDKMERLLQMQERILSRNAESEFTASMTRAQAKIGRVAADATNPQTRSKYATYAALDRVLRPVYTEEGFALSFDTGEAPQPDQVRVLCYVSHVSGHTRTHHVDMPADGKGAKGGDVMTKTHAAGAAMQYGMRYLLKLIFNVAVGEDDDGNSATTIQRITAKQAADIDALIDEVGADKAKFLRYFKIDSTDRLSAAAYKDAIAMLEAKRK